MIKKKIAIFHPEGNIGSNVNIKSIVNLLIDSGYFIDYIHYKTESIHDMDRLYFNDIIIQDYLPLSSFGSSWNFCIGIDDGVCDAAKIYQYAGIPFLFLSYENFFFDEARTSQEKLLIQRIKSAAKLACAAISQDELRAQSLQKEYGLSCPILKIPVAGTGCIPFEKSFLLHERCCIPTDKKILLHMGSIASWAMADWLAANVDTLPENWVLVFHGRYGISKKLFPHNKKIFYSCTQAKTSDELKQIIQSSDCCSVLYNPTYNTLFTGKNIEEIGLASTKFATALQHGRPVMVNDQKLMKNIILKYNCGIFIDTRSKSSLKDIEIKLNKIQTKNCHEAFYNCLDLKNTFKDLLEIIKKNTIKTPVNYTPPVIPQEVIKNIKKLPSHIVIRLFFSIFLLLFSKFLNKMKLYKR